MDTVKPLLTDQNTYGGTYACVVIACLVAKHVLRNPEKPRRKQIDAIIREGSDAWFELGGGDDWYPERVLKEVDDLSQELKIDTARSEPTSISKEVIDSDGNTILRQTKDVLYEWISDPTGSVLLVTTRTGFTFTIYRYEGTYWIIDTHSQVIESRTVALSALGSTQIEHGDTGAVLGLTFPDQVVSYVTAFMTHSIEDAVDETSNMIDITVVKLKTN